MCLPPPAGPGDQVSMNRLGPVVLRYGTAPSRFGQLWLPRTGETAPLVVLVHGGFWRRGKSLRLTEALAERLRDAGLAVWNVEYDAGADWQATLADVAAAIDVTARMSACLPLDGVAPVVVGHSAGGQLALWAAGFRAPGERAQQRVVPRAVVSLAGVCDLAYAAEAAVGEGAVSAFLGGLPDAVPERYRACCPAMRCPIGVRQLLVHGATDERVPVEASRRYLAAARDAGDPVELVEIPGADHRSLIDPETPPGREAVRLIRDVVSGTRPNVRDRPTFSLS